MPNTPAESYKIKGKVLTCRFCKKDKFFYRKTLMNTPGLTIFGLEWLNAEAENYVCENCGYVHWFLHE